MAPEFVRHNPYTKACDIYAFGMIMYSVGTGNEPFEQLLNDSLILSINICNGIRPKISSDIPKSFKKLILKCWNSNPDLRPDISEICDTLLKWWSSAYHKRLTPICLEFLAANNRNYSKSESLKIVQEPDISRTKNIVFPNKKFLEPSELINFIIHNHFTKFTDIDELTKMINIDAGHFGTISRAIWKRTGNIIVCKRLKNIGSISHKPIEAFLHELNMHRRLDFCSRIIRILGISFDESTQEYMFIMQYADGGNLRNYLQQKFSTLEWDDKIKLAYQITEGIKYLHGENILHRDLHSKNIVIHQGEAKIIDLGIAKSTETNTNLHSGVFGMIPYIDPKLLEDYSYKYDKKSDIYSLGVLMWELSSGYPPFINERDNILRHQLIGGLREEPVSDTPIEYLKLYKSCWDSEPDVRPSIDQVFTKLGKILNVQDDSNDIDTDDIDIIQDIDNTGNTKSTDGDSLFIQTNLLVNDN